MDPHARVSEEQTPVVEQSRGAGQVMEKNDNDRNWFWNRKDPLSMDALSILTLVTCQQFSRYQVGK